MNLFVAKLSSSTTGDDLQNLFSQYGEVTSAKVIIDRETGNSKGFGFVEMPNDEEANEAINALNESELDGNQIVVKKANPKTEAPRQGGGGGGFGQRRSNFQNRGGGGGGFQRRDDRRDDRRGGGGGGRRDDRGGRRENGGGNRW